VRPDFPRGEGWRKKLFFPKTRERFQEGAARFFARKGENTVRSDGGKGGKGGHRTSLVLSSVLGGGVFVFNGKKRKKGALGRGGGKGEGALRLAGRGDVGRRGQAARRGATLFLSLTRVPSEEGGKGAGVRKRERGKEAGKYVYVRCQGGTFPSGEKEKGGTTCEKGGNH